MLFSLMTVFQRDGSLVLENNIPRLLNRQELLKIFTSLKGRERIYNDQVSKVNVGRKGRAGASSQEEAFLKLSLTERDAKAVLVSGKDVL